MGLSDVLGVVFAYVMLFSVIAAIFAYFVL